MLSLLGFSAWISCGDELLPEFEVTTANSRVTCWIPCKEGKAFVIHWKDQGSNIDTAAFITLDGLVVPGRFLFGEGYAFRSGVRTSVISERPFVFSKVDEERESPELPIKFEGKVGMIILRIKRVKRTSRRNPNKIQAIPDQIRAQRTSGDDCVGFGYERPTVFQQPSTWAVQPYDKNNRSYVTFVFRYRSPEFLIAQGIMSQEFYSATPPTPGPSNVSTSSTNPTPPSAKRRRRTISTTSHVSAYSEPATSTQLDYSKYIDRYPGEGLLWFQDSQPTESQNI